MNKVKMMRPIYKTTVVGLGILLSFNLSAETTERLNYYQVMTRVINTHPSLKVADLMVQQASEGKNQVESQLGWMLDSSAGVQHDVSGFGTPYDRLDLNAAMIRNLESGATLSFSGGYSYEDNSLVFSSLLPNPAHTTRFDVNYRLPLLKGSGNPEFTQSKVKADEALRASFASKKQLKLSVAEQVKELFYAIASMDAQLKNAKQAVVRTRKLQDYINDRVKLGLSETKDQLQINAQLKNQLSQLDQVQLQLSRMVVNLNRLMSGDWDKTIIPELSGQTDTKNVSELLQVANTNHPSIILAKSKLNQADSEIILAKDTTEDNLDLVLSVGTRTSSGNNATSRVDEQDLAGAVRIEYKHIFDDRGLNAAYNQASLSKTIAIEELKKAEDDIQYNISGLYKEIELSKRAVRSSYEQLQSEKLKLKEAEKRYRNGRADISQVIQFQNELSISELAYLKQKVELDNRIISMQIMTGEMLDKLPGDVK